MDDYGRPLHNPAREDLGNRAWREGLQDRVSVIGPMIALVVALMLGLIMIAKARPLRRAAGMMQQAQDDPMADKPADKHGRLHGL